MMWGRKGFVSAYLTQDMESKSQDRHQRFWKQVRTFPQFQEWKGSNRTQCCKRAVRARCR